MLTPGTQCAWRLRQRNDQTYSLIYWKSSLFKKSDHGLEILRLGISRSNDVQLFLHKHSGFIADRFLGVTDVHDPARKSYLFDGSSKSRRCTDSFNDNVWAASFR